MTCHRLAALFLATLLVAGTSGCTSRAEDEAREQPRVLTVSGHGEARQTPDMSTISAGVRTQAASAQDALRANTAAMNAVFDAMRELGIADRDMQTSNFSVQPIYQQQRSDMPQTEPAKIIGYQVFNQVTVIVRDLSKLGGALDTFVGAGANELYGVGFDIADKDPLLDQARTAAVKDATRKAELLTKAAGVKLGRLMSLSESSSAPPMPMYRARAEMAASSPVPTAAGEQVLAAEATLTYEIQ